MQKAFRILLIFVVSQLDQSLPLQLRRHCNFDLPKHCSDTNSFISWLLRDGALIIKCCIFKTFVPFLLLPMLDNFCIVIQVLALANGKQIAKVVFGLEQAILAMVLKIRAILDLLLDGFTPSW